MRVGPHVFITVLKIKLPMYLPLSTECWRSIM